LKQSRFEGLDLNETKPDNCIYFERVKMDCKPDWINASIDADNLSMEAFSIADILSRKQR
jgi:hypothetical protein